MAPAYKLSYFDIMGLGEPIRVLLSYGALEFEDFRVTRENWPGLKSSMPMGQLPVLEVNGKTAHQSMAICRYLGKQLKLNGKDDWEDLEIDTIVDTINDFRAKIGQYHYQSNEQIKNEYQKTLVDEIIPFYVEKLDAIAKENGGYLVGGRLTWADLVFLGLVDYMNFMAKTDLLSKAPNLQKVKENVLKVPNVKNYVDKRPNNH
ncbi:glutathione S-transferase-like [Sitophilus oryzae]|uniref:glutathione transferase n=1 Tax=Sitophilus oryzae TaxID=7048 RepID=A0A4P2S818_SITOR|nr:glutathione S-transferase-like [Sitophilus oryzae]AVR54954.1 glutathione s-transferase sigma class 6 [Sitophilus oryzae]